MGKEASLIEEVLEVDEVLSMAGGPGSPRGSGGMASKLAAAKIAAWSGVRVVIASAERPRVLQDAVAGKAGVGTVVRPRQGRLPARKLWIAFALAPAGTVVVDAGARRALVERGVSLLPAGVREVRGDFAPEDAVEVAGPGRGCLRQGAGPPRCQGTQGMGGAADLGVAGRRASGGRPSRRPGHPALAGLSCTSPTTKGRAQERPARRLW